MLYFKVKCKLSILHCQKLFILSADKNKTLAQKVIEWKFDQLDKNKDEILKRRETRTIKRMVRKLIQPKACARMFLEYCDSDGDRMIKKKEWTYCLNTNASSSEYQYLFSFTKKFFSTMLTIILSVSRVSFALSLKGLLDPRNFSCTNGVKTIYIRIFDIS